MKTFILLLMLAAPAFAETTEVICTQEGNKYDCNVIVTYPAKSEPFYGSVLTKGALSVIPPLVRTIRFLSIEVGTSLTVDAIKELIALAYHRLYETKPIPPIKIVAKPAK
jgi:hypothetical protein